MANNKKTVNLNAIDNIITIGLYGGKSYFRGVKDTKYRAEVVTCDCKDCSLRDKGMCLKVTSPIYHTCVYGKKHIYEGFMPNAASSFNWKRGFQSHECYNKFHSVASGIHFGVIGDYYFIYTVFVGVVWNDDGTYKFETSVNSNNHIFVKKDDVNADFFLDLLHYKPYALFGGEIKDYREKVVTLILEQIQRLAPDLYKAISKIDTAITKIKPNYAGKIVYVKSLKPDIDIYSGNFIYHLSADRKHLTCDDYNLALPFRAKSAKIVIPVTDDMTYCVRDNSEICDDTEIAR